jgi:AraC-like DNA-binding protein
MHAEPGSRWTLHELAKLAGMSRSSFARTFKDAVGLSPGSYLARWRMLVARDRLIKQGRSVYAIAAELGYASESAFSTAFKRIVGCPPGSYGGGSGQRGELEVRTLRDQE